MTIFNEKEYLIGTAEYGANFWNAMRGIQHAYDKIHGGASRIFAKDCADIAVWVPEGGSIPLQDGVNDFTRYAVDSHKLAVFLKLDDDFVHDAAFNIEAYLTDRLAENFAKAEDKGFVLGTGEHMPTGILDDTAGAETGITTSVLSFDDVLRLYHRSMRSIVKTPYG